VGSEQTEPASLANIAVDNVEAPDDMIVDGESKVRVTIRSSALADRVVDVKLAGLDADGKPADTPASKSLVLQPLGGGQVVVMAGPCSVESRDQIELAGELVARAGGKVIRGGAFKPRTSPYDFQGLGVKGLRYLADARERTGLPVVTEVLSWEEVAVVAHFADMLQIGARNMQNFTLLRAASRSGKPILLKRGAGATIISALPRPWAASCWASTPPME